MTPKERLNFKGIFIEPSYNDKNYDVDYHKVPQIAETKKSFNIYASNHIKKPKQGGE